MEVSMAGFSKTQVAGFFIVGAAVGAAIALIYAPKSGTQIRKDIRRFSKKTVNQLDDLQSGIRGQVTEGYGKVKRMITTV
jgi:gas vesicle protein